MCFVHSAVTGEIFLVLEDYEGKTAKDLKQILGTQLKLGVSRFRQRFLSDGFYEIPDEEVFTSDRVKVLLARSEFWPPEVEEDQQMISASRDNDLGTLEALLRRPRNPNLQDKDGKTPLHHAAENGNVEAIRLLLEADEAGETRNARDTGTTGWAPLLLTAFGGHTDAVELLLQVRVDAEVATNRGSTRLYVAAAQGHVEVARLLIEALADVDKSRPDNEKTPLLGFAESDVLIFSWVNHGKSSTRGIYTGNLGFCSPRWIPLVHVRLCIAAQDGRLDVVRLLLNAGAEISQAQNRTVALYTLQPGMATLTLCVCSWKLG
jgi:hypothetical protein